MMPISAISIISDEPPYEKNGRDTPVFGMISHTTAIFRKVCMPTLVTIPNTVSAENVSGACIAILYPRQMNIMYRNMRITAPIKPISSHQIVKIKSFCASET